MFDAMAKSPVVSFAHSEQSPGELINHEVHEMPRPITIRSLETVTRGTGEVNISGNIWRILAYGSRAWVEKQAENAPIGLAQCGIVSRYRPSGHQTHRWQPSL